MTTANWLSDIEVDEVSLVDRPANQHARVAIAKRAPEETVTFYTEQGEAVEDIDDLEAGTVVYSEDRSQAFVIEESDAEGVEEQELELVGKADDTDDFAARVREDLSKALGDVERDDVISKAMGEVSKAQAEAREAQAIAKAERDLRLTREYISKADSYGVPGVSAQELGPVLMRAAESLSHEDCVVLHKAFTGAGAAFAELGTTGTASNYDAFGVIEELLQPAEDSELSKALQANGSDQHEAIEKAFDADPAAYDRYLASRQGR